MDKITLEQIQRIHFHSEVDRFLKWMDRQTCPVDGFYVEDYVRWVEQGKRSNQGEDWD